MQDAGRVFCARRPQHLFLSPRPAEEESSMSFKAVGLDHVAIVVADLDAAIRTYRDVLGLELAEVEEVPEQQVKTAIFGHGMGRIELICPTVKSSGVARFLGKRGEGLHPTRVEIRNSED